eukprot:11173270-Lingulodinium_polyedra.AAC.1
MSSAGKVICSSQSAPLASVRGWPGKAGRPRAEVGIVGTACPAVVVGDRRRVGHGEQRCQRGR